MCLQVNGLSTLFWGWGREDDELYLRMKEAKMTVCEFMHVLGLALGFYSMYILLFLASNRFYTTY